MALLSALESPGAGGRKRRAKEASLGKILSRVEIACRPKEIEHRATLGHWEGDTVFQGHKQSDVATSWSVAATNCSQAA